VTDAVAAVRADRDLVADVNDHVASLVRTPQWPAHCHAWTVQAARSCGQGWQLQWLDAQNEQLCGQDHVACIVCARVLLGPDLALADDGDVRAASTEESEQLDIRDLMVKRLTTKSASTSDGESRARAAFTWRFRRHSSQSRLDDAEI